MRYHHGTLWRQLALLWHHAVRGVAQVLIQLTVTDAKIAHFASILKTALLRVEVAWCLRPVGSDWSRHGSILIADSDFFDLLTVGTDARNPVCDFLPLLVLRLGFEGVPE